MKIDPMTLYLQMCEIMHNNGVYPDSDNLESVKVKNNEIILGFNNGVTSPQINIKITRVETESEKYLRKLGEE